MAAAAPHTAEHTLVLGAGIAGLAAALALRPRPVTLVTPGPIAAGAATAWAQGGIAAATRPDDGPDRHAADTLAAGGGLCDRRVVAAVTRAAPDAIRRLEAWGVRFDRDADGRRARGLEGGHSVARVLHAGGDRSGAAIRQALLAEADASPSIGFAPHARPTALLLAGGRVAGVRLQATGGGGPRNPEDLPARAVVLATGGFAALFAATTNPLGNWGGGLALAARAGARLRDLEFVQFHPTAIDLPGDPLALASEAIRGAGARLIDGDGEPVTAGVAGGDLAPRDRVAACVARAKAAGRRVYLDARAALGDGFAARFPGVAQHCRAAGLDPATQPIPVRPAAHFTMGGVAADTAGRTDLPGLWACGETAATGLHGANRLASNSLLEGVAMAPWVAASIDDAPAPRRPGRLVPDGPPLGAVEPGALAALRRVVQARVGVLRDHAGLTAALAEIDAWRASADGSAEGGADAGADGPADVALLLTAAALRRRESRGAHQRGDHPAPAPEARHSALTLASAQARAAERAARREAAA
ncbi:L-aspartate oxidase [Rhodovibrio sodomensis]|uniref:L-aspartate oxidase n=1 Tax=Rhodovibrio sodomensis TaxID=1088 RepID=A0ABS1DCY4_9PROT|nr:L-aspartate oxidase [Rhodovibrio sodomensis]MBK1667776.1 L-aspartate oxidase [Rhodovibrio sodomensis]